MHFETTSPKNSGLGYFCVSDGTIAINLDEIAYNVVETTFCNTENMIIATLLDVIIHEELHKRFDEADETHDIINEQDENIFRSITNWIENAEIS